MKTMRAILPALLLAGGALAGGVKRAPAQTAPAQHPSVFDQVFAQPTGTNGYEYLVRAGELTRDNRLLTDAAAAGSSLRLKRETLEQPDVQRALALVRAGLALPIYSPRTHIDQDTPFPEFALFRSVARILAIREYVQLADGQVGAAIDTFRQALRFALATQTEKVWIAGLVGIALDALAIQPIARHVDQLSVADCDRLMDVLRDWLSATRSVQGTLARERDSMLDALSRLKKDPAEEMQAIAGDDASGSSVAAALQANPAALASAVDEATTLLNTQFAATLQNLLLPPWQRQEWSPPATNSLGAKLFGMISVEPGRILDRYTQDRARIQLLACHVAIRSYRWEHDSLPASLAEVSLGDLAVDPFTGRELTYKPKGQTYYLYSEGPENRGDQAAGRTAVRVGQ